MGSFLGIMSTPFANATTENDGRFRFSLSKSAIPTQEQAKHNAPIVAVAKGFGPDWATVATFEEKGEMTLRLVKDDVPIKGRVLDLEGKPVAGAVVTLETIATRPDDDLAPFLNWLKTDPHLQWYNALKKVLYAPYLAGLPKSVRTDKEGRFTMSGIGRERVAMLKIEGPNIETATVWVIPRTPQEIKAAARAASENTMPFMPKTARPAIYGLTFDHLANPTKVIFGTVRDRATGKPLAGIKMSGHSTEAHWQNYATTFTDSQGRYRLVGVSKGKKHRVSAWHPSDGKEYLPSGGEIADTPGLEPVEVDFELERGVEIRGRIIDKVTRKPVPFSHLIYRPLKGNLYYEKSSAKGYFKTTSGLTAQANRNGNYRLRVLPGLGVLVVSFRSGRDESPYMQAYVEEADRKKPYFSGVFGEIGTFLGPEDQIQIGEGRNAYRVIDPSPDGGLTHDFELDPGKSITGKVLDPDGKPLAGAIVRGLTAVMWEPPQTLKSDSFTVIALDPRHPRKLSFVHLERKLAGQLVVRGDEKEPPSIRLQPWGVLSGRLIDPDGAPLEGLQVHLTHQENGLISYPVLWWKQYHESHVTTDKEGRFRVEGLTPSQTFTVGAMSKQAGFDLGDELKSMTVRAGEKKDLGDIKAKPQS